MLRRTTQALSRSTGNITAPSIVNYDIGGLIQKEVEDARRIARRRSVNLGGVRSFSAKTRRGNPYGLAELMQSPTFRATPITGRIPILDNDTKLKKGTLGPTDAGSDNVEGKSPRVRSRTGYEEEPSLSRMVLEMDRDQIIQDYIKKNNIPVSELLSSVNMDELDEEEKIAYRQMLTEKLWDESDTHVDVIMRKALKGGDPGSMDKTPEDEKNETFVKEQQRDLHEMEEAIRGDDGMKDQRLRAGDEEDGDYVAQPGRLELPTDPLPDMDPFPVIDVNAPLLEQTVLFSDIPFPIKLSEQPFSLRVCVLGTPNAGKSVLVNNMTRALVTAVSAKRNTTRRQTLGVITEANTQVTFYDTPGINEIYTAKQIQRELATEAWDAVGDADYVLVVMDAVKPIAGPELFMLARLKQVLEENPELRTVLVLNKVDLVPIKQRLLLLVDRLNALVPFTDVFMISASDGDGVADLENYLFMNALPREWEYDRIERTDQTELGQASEIVRQAVYQRMNKELPYSVGQETVEWAMLRNGSLRLDQMLLVNEDHHKLIVGAALRQIIEKAQKNLEKTFGRKVHLYLRVKTRSKNRPSMDN